MSAKNCIHGGGPNDQHFVGADTELAEPGVHEGAHRFVQLGHCGGQRQPHLVQPVLTDPAEVVATRGGSLLREAVQFVAAGCGHPGLAIGIVHHLLGQGRIRGINHVADVLRSAVGDELCRLDGIAHEIIGHGAAGDVGGPLGRPRVACGRPVRLEPDPHQVAAQIVHGVVVIRVPLFECLPRILDHEHHIGIVLFERRKGGVPVHLAHALRGFGRRCGCRGGLSRGRFGSAGCHHRTGCRHTSSLQETSSCHSGFRR